MRRAEPDLVGRDAELSQLHALLDEHAVVAVFGRAGVGKTSLVRAALATATWLDLSERPASETELRDAVPSDGIVVWDHAPAPAVELAATLGDLGAARLVVITRVPPPPQLAALAIAPLSARAMVELVRRHDERRAISLYERVAMLAGGDLRMAELILDAAHDGLQATTNEVIARLVQQGDVRRVIACLRQERRPQASALPTAVVEAFVRDGDLMRAAAALGKAGDVDVPAGVIQVAAASLPALRGDTERARELLRDLVLPPDAEGDRAAGLALAYLCDERYVRVIAATRRARRAYARCDVQRFATFVDVAEMIALLECDRLDDARARALSGSGQLDVAGPLEPLGRDVGVLFEAAQCGRRGDLATYLRLVEPVMASLEQRGDRAPHAVAARYVARACIALGRLDDAERYLRSAAALGAQPGMAALLSFTDRDHAALDIARGNIAAARARLANALERMPNNPYLVIDAWALRPPGALLPPACVAHPATRAYAALRGAERALALGEHAAAARASEVAERWYDDAKLLHETARARIARAEAAFHLGDHDGCRAALDRGLMLATCHGYRPLAVTGWLVAAALADRTGDLDGYQDALVRARDSAGPLVDAALARACARLDIATAPTSPLSPFCAVVERLKLARPATHVITRRAATFVVAMNEYPADATLYVDLADGCIVVGKTRRACPDLTLRLLARLAQAGDAGVSMETLYVEIWRGRMYQPLRHRNTIYVALQRLRTLLRPLIDGDPIERVDDGIYRIAISVAVRQPSAAPAFAIGA